VQLCAEAAEGAEGNLFDEIRLHGEDAFRLEEWGEAETPAEVRSLTREAQEQLCAQPIQSKGAAKSVRRPPAPPSLSDIEKILSEIRDGASEWEDEPIAPTENAGTPESRTEQQVVKAREKIQSGPKKEAPPKLASGRASSAAKERRIREALQKQREEREQLRQTRSTEESDEMRKVLLSIEARRLSQKKSTPKKKKAGSKGATAKKSATTTSRAAAGKASGDADRIATGRAKSSEKERRIREALQKEREERLARQRAQAAAEADEMAAILARIDSRSKQLSKQKRRR